MLIRLVGQYDRVRLKALHAIPTDRWTDSKTTRLAGESNAVIRITTPANRTLSFGANPANWKLTVVSTSAGPIRRKALQ